jgi:hypothetical protein
MWEDVGKSGDLGSEAGNMKIQLEVMIAKLPDFTQIRKMVGNDIEKCTSQHRTHIIYIIYICDYIYSIYIYMIIYVNIINPLFLLVDSHNNYDQPLVSQLY